MSVVLMLAAAAEKEAPLIDLDGTVFIQFGIFLVMAFALWTLVFKPFLAVKDAREAGIAGSRALAKGMEEKARASSESLEAQMRAARQRGADERLKLRAEAAVHEQQVVGAARGAANQSIAAARLKARAEEETARGKLLADAGPIAEQIAARLLGRAS